MYRFLLSFREIFLFSLPIIAGQIGHMLFGVGDTIIIGHYSTAALAALGIATGIRTPLKIVGLGITYVISPSKAQRLAEGGDVSAYPATSFVLAIFVGTVLTLVLYGITFLIDLIGLEPAIAAMVKTYLRVTALSMTAAILFQVLKENLQAYEKTVFANGLILGFNIVNILLNILLIITLDWGIFGAAVATTLSRYGMTAVLFIYFLKKVPVKWNYSPELLKQFLLKGIPSGLGGVVTALVFSAVTVLSGKMEVAISAANNLIIVISSVTFMVPYAISSAVSVKVGQNIGRGSVAGVARSTGAATLLGLISAGVMVAVFLNTPEQILNLMSGDREVIAYGTILLFAVAVYQVPDAIMYVVMGALRGIGITFSPMIWNIVGLWGVGLPAGIYLAYSKGMDALGLWYGLAIGLTVTAAVFCYLFLKELISLRNQNAESVITSDPVWVE